MSSTVIDRRLNGKYRSLPNRERFIRRYKSQLKRAVSDVAAGSSISDVSADGKIRVRVPAKEIAEPTFVYGEGGDRERVIPGNRDFIPGDRIPRPENSSGKGGAGRQPGKGSAEDAFTFVLSREEFLGLYFDDLELPELLKKELTTVKLFKSHHAGYTHSGSPTALSVLRTMKASVARRMALGGLFELKPEEDEADEKTDDDEASEEVSSIAALAEKEAQTLRKSAPPYVPFLDEIDLRFRHRVITPEPSTNAVMFCLMDVSASMDEQKKDLAKRFYTLLYLFLTKKYEAVSLVFIRHTDEAEEVDEHTFFYGNKSGGTEILPAIDLMSGIMKERFPASHWNIYVAQASDGDASERDARAATAALAENIMPGVRYYAYVETMPSAIMGLHRSSDLWDAYECLTGRFDGFFSMRKLFSRRDIYPVFRGLFEKRAASARWGGS
jgi:uncharacterized sporulation protein YeaH/YhbH (DUF444 family)